MSNQIVEQGGWVQLRDPPPRAGAGATATCASCVAVCCRLTVVLEPGDAVPACLTSTGPQGLRVMAKGPTGKCVALEADGMTCGIYAMRPQACRRFAENGPYCRALRAEHAYAAGLASLL